MLNGKAVAVTLDYREQPAGRVFAALTPALGQVTLTLVFYDKATD